jgi:hypothetical protein
MLTFRETSLFRECIFLSLLAQKCIAFKPQSGPLRLSPKQKQLLDFVLALSQNSSVEYDSFGESLVFHPGLIRSGEVSFACGKRSEVGYFAEPLVLLSIVIKAPLRVLLTGPLLTSEWPLSGVQNLLKYFSLVFHRDFKLEISNYSFEEVGAISFLIEPFKVPIFELEVEHIVSRTWCKVFCSKMGSQLISRCLSACRRKFESLDIECKTKKLECRKDTVKSLQLLLEGESLDTVAYSHNAFYVGNEPVEDFCDKAINSFLTALLKKRLVIRRHLWLVLSMMACSFENLTKLKIPFKPEAGLLGLIESIFSVKFAVRALDGPFFEVSCIGTSMAK